MSGPLAKLPNPHLASVDRRKVVDYLLDATHPDNGGKAEFFASLGFSTETAWSLVAALRAVAARGNTVDHVESVHGRKDVVDGLLLPQTGIGIGRRIRTIWIVEPGQDAPRLVTAYPNKG